MPYGRAVTSRRPQSCNSIELHGIGVSRSNAVLLACDEDAGADCPSCLQHSGEERVRRSREMYSCELLPSLGYLTLECTCSDSLAKRAETRCGVRSLGRLTR